MKGKKKKTKNASLGLELFLFGCVFLFEPFLGVYDILPDIIGALLICAGLRKLAFFEKKLMESAARFKVYIWVCIARIAVEILASMKDSVFDSTMLLTFAFVFGVLDCILLIPAFLAFFEGMEYVYVRGDGSNLGDERDTQNKNIHVLAVVFVIVRAAAPVLPMFSVLGVQSATSFETLHTLLTVMCALISLVLGAAWLAGMKKYLAFYRSDTAFTENILSRYEKDILPDTYLWNKIYSSRFSSKTCGAILLLFGVPFSTYMQSRSAYYILPEFLFGVIILWALFDFRSYINEKRAVRLCVAYTVAAAAFYGASMLYASQVGGLYQPQTREGFAAYFIPCAALRLISCVLFALVCHEKYRAFRDFTGASVGLRGKAKTDTRKDYDSAIKRNLQKHGKGLFVLEAMFALVSAAAYIASPWLELAWVAQFVLCIVLLTVNYIVTHMLAAETEMAI